MVAKCAIVAPLLAAHVHNKYDNIRMANKRRTKKRSHKYKRIQRGGASPALVAARQSMDNAMAEVRVLIESVKLARAHIQSLYATNANNNTNINSEEEFEEAKALLEQAKLVLVAAHERMKAARERVLTLEEEDVRRLLLPIAQQDPGFSIQPPSINITASDPAGFNLENIPGRPSRVVASSNFTNDPKKVQKSRKK